MNQFYNKYTTIGIMQRVIKRLSLLLERIQYRNCDPSIFTYRDCFETIRVVTSIIKPKYLCDIGANAGHWAYVMRQLNDELQHVTFFEPQKHLVEKLHSLSLTGVKKVIYDCGLGSKEETLAIKGGTASASVLDAASTQTHYFPGSVRDEQEKVEIKVLDNIYKRDDLPYPDLIKIDVQGYELNVLEGALNVLSKTKYLVIELSFQNFYEGQPQLWKVLKFLEEHDFVMIDHGFEWKASKRPFELLQMDGLFVNSALVDNFRESRK